MFPHPKFVRSQIRFLAALGLLSGPLLAQQPSSPRKTSSAKPPDSGKSVLLVDTDDTCRLLIDDEDKGVMSSDHSQKFNVSVGEHILKCTVEAVPDLFWRKVVDAKESSQVAALITLKALHLQYNQAVTKTKSQKEEADSAATKQLAEAEAAEKLRKEELDAFPQKMFEQVKGHWSCVHTTAPIVYYDSLDFVSMEDGLIVAYYITSNSYDKTQGAKWKLVFKPAPGRLVGVGLMHCVGAKGRYVTKRGSTKDNEGYAECSSALKDEPNPGVTVNEDALQFSSNRYAR
jgi:hypothetical protein